MPRKSDWTKEEDDILKKEFPLHGYKGCIKYLNRTPGAISGRTAYLGIKKLNEPEAWLKKDEDFLKEKYPTHGPQYCADYLNRSKDSVLSKASKLKIKCELHVWTEEDKDFLRNNLDKTSKELGNYLNKSRQNVSCTLRRMGLNCRKVSFPYTLLDDNFIIENYETHGSSYCAEHLNRTPASIVNRIKILRRKGYKIDKYRKKASQEYRRSTSQKIRKEHKYCLCHKEIPGALWGNIKARCRQKGWCFEECLSIEEGWNLYIKQNKQCALTGEIIFFGNNRTASLDRIDSDKSYVLENCQWVHKDINFMKMNLPEDKFIKYCKLVAEHAEKNSE